MTFASALEDAERALRLLRAHPQVETSKLAAVGFSFGGAIAALLGGREQAMRAVVLAAAIARWRDSPDPAATLAKAKARVLLIWGSEDDQVPIENAHRYIAALTRTGVANEMVIVEGADHDFGPGRCRAEMTARVADFARESFG
ncbi:MAG: hypothetical protein AUH85_02755 [Chloroflexi bacterium 13_1_40CM_4_68_4]|nr:MAG: hypothetical protein AUH85_02755 [Chloroflexi bacterium 13_1_40CM_4_68_4]